MSLFVDVLSWSPCLDAMCLFAWRVEANRGTAEGSRGGEGVNVFTQAGLLNTQCPFDLCAELNVWGKL